MFNNTIDNFIEKFESTYGKYLDPKRDLKLNGREATRRRTNFFTVCLAEKKFSDWDLHCWVKDNATPEILRAMSRTIYENQEFDCLGHMFTVSQNHTELFHHPNKIPYLQFMGFLPKESFAPFVDIHIQPSNRNRKIIYKTFTKPLDNQFINWLLITYWRKLVNKDFDRADNIGNYLTKIPEIEYDKIKLNAPEIEKIFNKNKNFKKIVNFLAV